MNGSADFNRRRRFVSRGVATTADHMGSNEAIPTALLQRIAGGEAVVYPTTTLPALGCRPEREPLDRLYQLKQRAANQPVSLAVANLSQASAIAEIPEDTDALLQSFPTGSITLLLKARETLDARLGGELVAIRVVAHPTAIQLLQEVGPLTATSANLSGVTPETACGEAANALGLPAEAVLNSNCPGGLPSTLIRWNGHASLSRSERVEVLREGIVSESEVMSWSKNLN
uniref:L-threonylcarbamoyladenylate synthase n=1 Tax=uncultured marine group II/III euryarchaeote KM3_178_D06 TaxID=1457940 RepID=A0A075GS06_9EURY|nr:Sua5/YciO/YrdC/YwlC family protein (rimN, SUA5) [uncultured marine group II/III euryarchaeote KM3_178_D06]